MESGDGEAGGANSSERGGVSDEDVRGRFRCIQVFQSRLKKTGAPVCRCGDGDGLRWLFVEADHRVGGSASESIAFDGEKCLGGVAHQVLRAVVCDGCDPEVEPGPVLEEAGVDRIAWGADRIGDLVGHWIRDGIDLPAGGGGQGGEYGDDG